MQIVGLSNGYDQMVIRGDVDGHSFAGFYLQKGRLLAVDAINSPREFMLGKKLIAAKAVFDPEQLGLKCFCILVHQYSMPFVKR